MGKVTQIIPPNYGIVDGTAFYVTQCVKGTKHPVVRTCKNTDWHAQDLVLTHLVLHHVLTQCVQGTLHLWGAHLILFICILVGICISVRLCVHAKSFHIRTRGSPRSLLH